VIYFIRRPDGGTIKIGTTIRREAMRLASEGVAENIDDLVEQESVIAVLGWEIDEAIERSRRWVEGGSHERSA
jgi:hypothetical protein